LFPYVYGLLDDVEASDSPSYKYLYTYILKQLVDFVDKLDYPTFDGVVFSFNSCKKQRIEPTA